MQELEKFDNPDCEVYVINMKPMYRDLIVEQITQQNTGRLKILDIGKVYEW